MAKAEHLNPSGSLKDRSVRAMILAALASGALTPGADHPRRHQRQRRDRLRHDRRGPGLPGDPVPAGQRHPRAQAHPADLRGRIMETDSAQGSDGAQRRARELHRAEPERYFYADQYNNDANWRAHYRDHRAGDLGPDPGPGQPFRGRVGTSGLFTGTARRLKQSTRPWWRSPCSRTAAEHRLAGLKHMATAIVPGIYDPRLADAQVEVSSAEGQAMARRLAREEGLLVGPSTGRQRGRRPAAGPRPAAGSVVVTVLFDSGGRYLGDAVLGGGFLPGRPLTCEARAMLADATFPRSPAPPGWRPGTAPPGRGRRGHPGRRPGGLPPAPGLRLQPGPGGRGAP